MPITRPLSVVIDCLDPSVLVPFWRAMVGGETDSATLEEEWVSLKDVEGIGYLSFQRVPEPRSAKNRVHLDLEVVDITAAADEAEALGATRLGGVVDEITNLLQVMADPEGNEFCLIQRTPGRTH
ncbi:MAG: hypothetical protein RJB65_1807 [Actinomycetota bacterium]|jgi:predicted enzyme related to lactoylglutathione lyase